MSGPLGDLWTKMTYWICWKVSLFHSHFIGFIAHSRQVFVCNSSTPEKKEIFRFAFMKAKKVTPVSSSSSSPRWWISATSMVAWCCYMFGWVQFSPIYPNLFLAPAFLFIYLIGAFWQSLHIQALSLLGQRLGEKNSTKVSFRQSLSDLNLRPILCVLLLVQNRC